MPWIEATLRGERVFARAREDGSLAAEGGRVEIRYKPNDGRVYRASLRNLERLPDAPLLWDPIGAPMDAPAHAQSSADRTAPSHARSSAGDALEAQAAGATHDSADGPTPARTPRPARAASGAWIAYTDGACSGNPGPAGCGVVLVGPDGKLHEGLEYLGEATNNVAELTGILRAVEWTPVVARTLVVHTDSQYAIGVLQRGWKAKANQDLVSRTKRAVEDRRARLVYVPGHQGVSLNERADELAREAVLTHRTRIVET